MAWRQLLGCGPCPPFGGHAGQPVQRKSRTLIPGGPYGLFLHTLSTVPELPESALHLMTDPSAQDTAERATPAELRRASFRLFLMFLALTFLVVPVIRELPLGQTTRIGLLAWLLVALSLYWLYAGLGFRALLLPQLLLFSMAATLLTTKAGLVLVGVDRLSILRRAGRSLILLGAILGALNLAGMLRALWLRRRSVAG
jgi:hypothetical protein